MTDRHGAPVPSVGIPGDAYGDQHVQDFVNYMSQVSGSTFRTDPSAWRNGDDITLSAPKVKRAKEAIRRGRVQDD